MPVAPRLSVAVTVKVERPAVDGVPLSRPFVARVMPDGRPPEVTANVYGPGLCDAVMVWLYAVDCRAFGNSGGLPRRPAVTLRVAQPDASMYAPLYGRSSYTYVCAGTNAASVYALVAGPSSAMRRPSR